MTENEILKSHRQTLFTSESEALSSFLGAFHHIVIVVSSVFIADG
jgi:hypothetical protein